MIFIFENTIINHIYKSGLVSIELVWKRREDGLSDTIDNSFFGCFGNCLYC